MNRRIGLPLLLLSLFVLPACTGTGRDLGLKVTRDHVRSVRVGMTRAETETLLGAPFAEELVEPGHVELTYSRPTFGRRFYPMLWIHLRDGQVAEVYAKRYGFFYIDDDIGIYGLSNDQRFERPEFSQLFPE